MSAIGPGDWVECINDAPRKGPGKPFAFLVKGRVYCVSSLHFHPALKIPSLCVIGGPKFCEKLSCDGLFGGHGVDRFRPIYRPKSELLESLLRKSDEPVKEMA